LSFQVLSASLWLQNSADFNTKLSRNFMLCNNAKKQTRYLRSSFGPSGGNLWPPFGLEHFSRPHVHFPIRTSQLVNNMIITFKANNLYFLAIYTGVLTYLIIF
jgi:hypothetical protein